MDVDAATLDGLLELQAEDGAIGRLQERRATLPEASRLRQVSERLAELSADLDIARKQLDEVTREQGRLEGEIEVLQAKIGREEQRMYSGSVANPKELSALQGEVEMLKRRGSQAEDALLEVMVNRDAAEGTVAALESEHSATATEAGELEQRVGALTGEIDRELQEHSSARAALAAGLPADLVKVYEQIRDAKGGVGAAELLNGTCQGCHTKLPAVEVERLRRERGLQRCDNCRRILVVR